MGFQTTEDGTLLTNTTWPLAGSTTTIVETGGSLAVDGGDLEVDGTVLVAGGTVTTASGGDLSGSGTTDHFERDGDQIPVRRDKGTISVWTP